MSQAKITDSFKTVKTVESFYGKKKEEEIEEIDENVVLKTISNSIYTPTTRKIVELSSSDSDSGSDVENTVVKKVAERSRIRKNSGNDCPPSPPKLHKLSPRKLALSPTRKGTPKVPSTHLGNFHITDSPRVSSRKQLFPPKGAETPRTRRMTSAKINDAPVESSARTPAQRGSSNVGATPLGNLRITDSPKVSSKKELFSPKEAQTPRSSVNSLSAEKLTPKILFGSSVFQNARKSLHSARPDFLPGREKEAERLEEFISNHVKNKTSGSLYISGPPGTGKTATFSSVIEKPKWKSSLKTVFINCTEVKSAQAIYGRIFEEFGIETKVSARSKKRAIEEFLVSKHKMLILVLDEIDQLSSSNQQVLYTIFDWTTLPKSQLILVGIANVLDLTERILPRLQTRCEITPEIMIFGSYTKEQIQEIIRDRLRRAGATEVFPETAISFLAMKVSAVSGDIRKSLDISRRVIEFVESRKSAHALKIADDTEPNAEAKETKPEEFKVGLKDVLEIINAVPGSQKIDEEERNFTLQQKIILCSFMLMLGKGKSKDNELGKIYKVYEKVCRKYKHTLLRYDEFVGVCNLIDVHGIINISSSKKESRLSKVILKWDQETLIAMMSDKQLTTQIIDDVSCL